MADVPDDLARAIAEFRRDSRRFQEEMDAARRALSLPDFRAKVLEMVRSWRRDPYFVLLNPHLPLKLRRTAARRIVAQKSPIRVTDPAVRAVELRGRQTVCSPGCRRERSRQRQFGGLRASLLAVRAGLDDLLQQVQALRTPRRRAR